jgi:hypothetical protein
MFYREVEKGFQLGNLLWRHPSKVAEMGKDPLAKVYVEEVQRLMQYYTKAKARAASQAAKRTCNDVTAKEDTSQNKLPRTRRTASRSPLSGRSSSTDTPLAPRDEQPTLSSYRCAHHCQHALCG